jgi:hypothetical protein
MAGAETPAAAWTLQKEKQVEGVDGDTNSPDQRSRHEDIKDPAGLSLFPLHL